MKNSGMGKSIATVLSVASLIAADSLYHTESGIGSKRTYPSLGHKGKQNRVTCPKCGNEFKVKQKSCHSRRCKNCGESFRD